MLLKVAKEFRWEMGHRLSWHTEGCQTPHGHSYRMAVELLGTLNQNGMVIDYGDIKKVVEPILESLDHSIMLAQDDPILPYFQEQEFKVTAVPFHPTAENIALWFIDQLKPSFQPHPNLKTLTVRVYETKSALAEASIEL